ncbi:MULTISPECIES: hypothetical protein [unclassified Streptomyces]|uniref:hypothetical protein n=1 Tax=unclassified Streptomyces TaxID=2593676 RepID=UPI0004C55A15|nr:MULTISPECIES: hypothetical protein [unclassified Streptomyces]KJY18389.1 hypothetical protein VR43_25200 [Streptomyces sp. NRRL S-104]
MTPAEAREALDTARTEAEQARGLVADLAERVREGDEDVTGEQILAQRQLAELAGLRVEAAERKLAAAVGADRDARAKAVAAAARKLISQDDMQPVYDAAKAAVEALQHLVAVSTARTERIKAVSVEAVIINDELKAVARAAAAAGMTPGGAMPIRYEAEEPWPSAAYGFRGQTFPPTVTVLGEGTATAVRPGRMAASVLALALTDDRQLAGEAREVFNASFSSTIERLMAEVPGLDEVLRKPAQG